MCVSCGWEGTAKRLIDAGADIHLADDCGRSPLLMSCLMCHPECTELLLEAGADTEQAMTSINSGATALYAACIGRRQTMISSMIEPVRVTIDGSSKYGHLSKCRTPFVAKKGLKGNTKTVE